MTDAINDADGSESSYRPRKKKDTEEKPKFKKFYLAHPFGSREQLREWELKVEEKLCVEIVNPFYDVERPDKKVIEEKGTNLDTIASRSDRYNLSDKECKKLVERDIELIKDCDYVIAIIDGSLSYGTIQEMVYADLHGKPLYAVVSNGHNGHPWLRYHASLVFEDLDELYKYIKQYRSDPPIGKVTCLECGNEYDLKGEVHIASKITGFVRLMDNDRVGKSVYMCEKCNEMVFVPTAWLIRITAN